MPKTPTNCSVVWAGIRTATARDGTHHLNLVGVYRRVLGNGASVDYDNSRFRILAYLIQETCVSRSVGDFDDVFVAVHYACHNFHTRPTRRFVVRPPNGDGRG